MLFRQGSDEIPGEQASRSVCNCLVRPLPLDFNTEMGACFLEGDLSGKRLARYLLIPARFQPLPIRTAQANNDKRG